MFLPGAGASDLCRICLARRRVFCATCQGPGTGATGCLHCSNHRPPTLTSSTELGPLRTVSTPSSSPRPARPRCHCCPLATRPCKEEYPSTSTMGRCLRKGAISSYSCPGLGCMTTSQTDPAPRLHHVGYQLVTMALNIKTVPVPKGGLHARQKLLPSLGRQ